jgi:radical SAM protein with 4Fe4S-binding SPASM domain
LNNFKLNEIKIEVTHNCPLACVHCSSIAGSHQNTSISIAKCTDIINEAIALGTREIAFSGGEPLVWSGITEAVAYSKNKGLAVSIYTSGNCDNLATLLAVFSKVGVDRLIFSLYSDVAIEHNRVTRKSNSFFNTLEAIRQTQAYGIAAEIHFVALASTFKKLIKISELAKSKGISKVSVLRFVPQGRGKLIRNKDTLTKEQNLELKDMITELRNKGFIIRTGSPFNVLFLNEHPECLAAQDRLIIDPYLNIFPCDAFKQISSQLISPNDNYSNLTKHCLVDCWNQSAYFETVRKAVKTEPSEPCNSCSNHPMCLSGCLAQKYLHYSDLLSNPDPACLVRSETI